MVFAGLPREKTMPIVGRRLFAFARLERLRILRATIRLLYICHPRAFITSSFASLPEPLFYPAMLLVLHQLLQSMIGAGGSAQFSVAMVFAGVGVLGLFLV